jgi:predicted anti-sigma-YlaC factor YlaD
MATSCDRVRHWAALAPDGVLSELEQRLLEAHLVYCGPCRGFSATVDGFTHKLRAAPRESLSCHELVFRVPRRRIAPLLPFGAVAAVAAIAVMSPSLVRSVGRPDVRTVSTSGPPIIIDVSSVDKDAPAFLRQLRDYSHTGRVVPSDESAAGHPGPIAG